MSYMTTLVSAANDVSWDNFGQSVAISAVDSENIYVAVGEPSYDFGAYTETGTARVIKYNGTSWGSYTDFNNPDSEASAYFGRAIAIDDDYLVVGAPFSNGSGSMRGKVYIYKRSALTGVWSYQTSIVPASPVDIDLFGNNVSVYKKDSSNIYIAVGSHASNSWAGKAYISEGSSSSWSTPTLLVPNDIIGMSRFGESVAIDGNYVVVGENGYDSTKGRAHIFFRDSGSWGWQATISLASPIINRYT